MMEKDSNCADISAKDTVRKHNLTHTKHSMLRYINKQKATINYQNSSLVVVVVLLYGLASTRLQHSKNIHSCVASQ